MGERTHTATGFRVAEPCCPARWVQLIPTKRQCLAGTPPANGEEASNCDCRWPDACCGGPPKRSPERLVFGIREPPIALAICWTHDAMHWIIRAHPAPYRIGENCAQQTHRSVGRAFASPHACQSTRL